MRLRLRRRRTGASSGGVRPDRERPPRRAAPAAFTASVSPITTAIRRRIASSYREGCPVPLGDLRYLRLSHWDFAGRVRQGELVVHAKHAEALVRVFRKLYAEKFPIQRMRLVSDYDGDDERSMAANNTSAFNCRTVAGTDRWSQHSFGAAIDLNPVQNPYVTEAGISPAAGKAYARSGDRRPRSRASSPLTRSSCGLPDAGWEWGGDWSEPEGLPALLRGRVLSDSARPQFAARATCATRV